MNVENDSDLDLSWTDEYNNSVDDSQNYCREPMEDIDIYFVYINRFSEIDNLRCETHPLQISSDRSCSILSNQHILHLIQSNKKSTLDSKYKLFDILVYSVPLEPENVHDFSKMNEQQLGENSKSFLRSISAVNDIHFTPSIFVFHHLNSLFFLFKEKLLAGEQHNHTKKKIQSILKPVVEKDNDQKMAESTNVSKKSTKKVRIALDNNTHIKINNHSHTAKIRME